MPRTCTICRHEELHEIDQVNPPSDFEARKIRRDTELRRRPAAKRHIGSEFNDLRYLNYQRYYGPSD